jgi:polysaccharide pyruvyl transferase WcaK-like protein
VTDEYHQKLDEHSFVHRVDPLRDAARRAVSVWHQEDNQEKNDLSEEFWSAMGELETVLESVKR